jgi:hypothetical protein
MVGFDDGTETRRRLNELPDDQPLGALDRALPVEGINANLTSRLDVTQARRLKENAGISFMGDTKVGPFDISEAQARRLLAAPNPHGRPNSDVVRPWVNGLDITRRPRDMWIIDFPPGMPEGDAAMYEAPFEYIRERVRPNARCGQIWRRDRCCMVDSSAAPTGHARCCVRAVSILRNAASNEVPLFRLDAT